MWPAVLTTTLQCRVRHSAFLVSADVAAGVSNEPDSDAAPLLAAHDYSRLKALVRRLRDPADPAARVLAEKLGRCSVVPPRDMPPWVAALGARVVFAAEDGV